MKNIPNIKMMAYVVKDGTNLTKYIVRTVNACRTAGTDQYNLDEIARLVPGFQFYLFENCFVPTPSFPSGISFEQYVLGGIEEATDLLGRPTKVAIVNSTTGRFTVEAAWITLARIYDNFSGGPGFNLIIQDICSKLDQISINKMQKKYPSLSPFKHEEII